MQHKYLILGGTKEAAALAADLAEQGHDVTTSLAGRTNTPDKISGKTRIGGFGGAKGLAEWITKNSITKVFDLTHPYAEQISRNALEAVNFACVPLEIRHRAPWEKHPDDRWNEVANLEAAALAIPPESRVLLALGSQYLQPFQSRTDVHFVVRMIDEPESPLTFTKHTLILAKPSLVLLEEATLLKTEKITHIVCRNSGGVGSYAKIEAARNMSIPVIIIGRPS